MKIAKQLFTFALITGFITSKDQTNLKTDKSKL